MSAEENRGFRTIANVLNEEGVPTARSREYAPHCRGVWEGATIRSILMNPIYVGDMTWNRRSEATFHRIRHGSAVERRDLVGPTMVDNDESDWIRVENAHPPLVSRRLFSLARLARESRPAPGRGRSERVSGGWVGWRAQYLLSGLITCARCGGRYEGSSSGYEMAQRDGTTGRVRYYACGTTIRRGRRACVFGSVQRDVMESVVCRELTRFYAPLLGGHAETRVTKMIALAQSEDAKVSACERARLVEESNHIDATIANLLDNLAPANRVLANDRITALGKDRERIERRLYDLDRIVMNADEARATARETCAFLADLERVLKDGGVIERISAVRKCVASLVYDSGARTAVLRLFRVPGANFRGGIAEVTLSIPSTLRQPKPQGGNAPKPA